MTKAERLTLTTMTANAWHTLHIEELNNANSATSWATYEALNTNKFMHGLRSEWSALYEFCEAVHIDMNDYDSLDPSVATIMEKGGELCTEAWRIYREFPDYPFHDRNNTATNQNDEKEG
jgi:hypothetical protein